MRGPTYFRKIEMWKMIVAFALFAGLALFFLSKGGDIDMSGEKHGGEATHAPAPAAAAPAAPASAAAPASTGASASK
jgi:cytosine/uracil/thiamine/allantoin permease